MVRLKVECCTVRCHRYIGFQFQYGAIKSSFILNRNQLSILFQFQYGAIKSTQSAIWSSVISLFQFQYGAIKSLLRPSKRG